MSLTREGEVASGQPEAILTIQPLDVGQLAEPNQSEMVSLEGAPSVASALQMVLGPILQASPDLATALTKQGRYLVEFSATGRAALQGGAAHLVRLRGEVSRPRWQARQGKFLENAKVVSSVATGVVAATAAVAHLAILIAVQAQLVDMERTLDRIEKKIDELRMWLKNEKLAEFHGRLKALCQLRDEMASADWATENRHRWQIDLDQADTQFHQVEDFARRGCGDAKDTIARVRLKPRLFGSSAKKLLGVIDNEINKFRDNYDLRLMCLAGRLAVAHLRRGLGGISHSVQLDRDIQQALTAAQEHEKLLEDRALDFTTWFRTAGFETETRRRIRDAARGFRERSERVLQALREQTATLDPGAMLVTRTIVEVNASGQLGRVLLVRGDRSPN